MIHLQPSLHNYDKRQDMLCTFYMRHEDHDLNDHKDEGGYPVKLKWLLWIQKQMEGEEQGYVKHETMM